MPRSARTIHVPTDPSGVRPARLGRHDKKPVSRPPRKVTGKGVPWVPQTTEVAPDDTQEENLFEGDVPGYAARRKPNGSGGIPSNQETARQFFNGQRDPGADDMQPQTEEPRDVYDPTFFPKPTPQEAESIKLGRIAQQYRSPIQTRHLAVEDVDRLWDWLRHGSQEFHAAFGFLPKNSQELFTAMQKFLEYESQGTALIRSIVLGQENGDHLGFVFLMPIQRAAQGGTALVHMFLAPDARGYLPKLLPHLIAAAEREVPDLNLSVTTKDVAFARMLQQYGFVASTVLTRPARRNATVDVVSDSEAPVRDNASVLGSKLRHTFQG